MSEEVELNLDTQARRLAELNAVIDAALNDTDASAEIPEAPHQQSYEDLTNFNAELCEQRAWSAVDLDAALTDSQRQAWGAWKTKHRLAWRPSDYLAIGAVGVVGLMCCWFDASLDGAVRNRLDDLVDGPVIKAAEAGGKRLPIDHMGPGFGGRAHRIKSAGHDLARPIEAIRQVMDGEFRGVRWQDGVAIEVTESGRFCERLTLPQAMLRLGQHLLADVVTEMSLPIPGMSFLYESSNGQALRDFALHSYSGLGRGTGWNLRSGLLTPSMTVLVTEVLMRTYVHAESLRTTGSAVLSAQEERKRTELLLAAHSLVSAISLGKLAAAVAAHALAGDRLRAVHPSQIRHANIPAMLRAGTLAGTVVTDAYRQSQIPGARSWDELVIATAQPWQLDLVERIEELGTSADEVVPNLR